VNTQKSRNDIQALSVRPSKPFIGALAGRGWLSMLVLLVACLAPPRFAEAAPKVRGASSGATAERPPGGAPDILMILLDEVGFAGLNCFGGRVDTPNLDQLARDGLRYTAFNAAATGAKTRAALLTGRSPLAGPAAGGIPASAPMLPVLLRPFGYASFALGQWDLVPVRERSAALGRFEHWPTGRGFGHFYGWLSEATSPWYPELYRDTTPVIPPRSPAEGYHASEDLVDNAIRYIDDLRSADPARPYFMYLGLGTAGATQEAPLRYRELYRGRFAQGWDREREMVFERQRVIAVIPPETRLPPRDPSIPDWAGLDAGRQALFQAYTENAAGSLTHADAQIGRLLEHLRAAGRLDNTLILVASAGGAGAEGGAEGALNRVALLNGVRPAIGDLLARRDQIGDPATAPVLPWGWASLWNLPFRGGAGTLENGGIRAPLIVHWPKGMASPGSIRRQWLSAADVVPTVLDLLKLPPNPGEAPSLAGASFLPTFTDASAPAARDTLALTHQGSRAVYHRGWKAVAVPGKEAGPGDVGREVWRLYHLDRDFAEAEDLAAAEPRKLAELQARYWSEAGRAGLAPPESGAPAPASTPEDNPSLAARVREFRFFAGMSPLPEALAPNTFGRSYNVTAFLDRSGGPAEGVVAAQGGMLGGWTLYVQAGKPRFVYHSPAGTIHAIAGATELPAGRTQLRYRFTATRNHRGKAELFVDARKVGEVIIEQPAVVTFGSEPFDVGRDSQSPVSPDYRPPFAYTGVIERVEVSIED
jgi:arylsulfatase A-like enzyme